MPEREKKKGCKYLKWDRKEQVLDHNYLWGVATIEVALFWLLNPKSLYFPSRVVIFFRLESDDILEVFIG